ncbi:HAMP domain-containing sensor histidine kinase [Lysinibacillus sp. KU-BSD001]|uniref:sensor histidine kinase n=1 Tax=Lysinibacillus sp. KU-BSD001 TaxID=3141328 RepID=UPI0036E69C63
MKKRLFLTLFLIFLAALGVWSFLIKSQGFIGQNYFDSHDMMNEQEYFLQGLKEYILDPIDFEQAERAIQVNDDEIMYYREYYGSLEEQLANIRAQYESAVTSEETVTETETVTTQEETTAEEKTDTAPATSEAQRLQQERDQKLAEVRRNFESDEVVKEKILAIKKQALAKYKVEYEKRARQFKEQYSYFTYRLTNEAGEVYEKKSPEKIVNRTQFKKGDELYIDGDRAIYLDDYIADSAGISNTYMDLSNASQSFTGEVSLLKSAMDETGFAESYNIFTLQKWVLYTLWVISLVSISLLATMLKPSRELFSTVPELEEKFHRLPLDIRLVIPMITGLLAFNFIESFPYRIESQAYFIYRSEYYLNFEEAVLFLFGFAFTAVAIVTAIWGYDAVKREGLSAENSIFIRLVEAGREAFLNKSIGQQTVAMFIVFFLAGLGFAGVLLQPALLLIYAPLFMFVLLPVLYVYLKRMGYLNRVMQKTEDMAAGRLTTAIEVKGNSPIAKHAENLNALRQGVELSMHERAKSERLKTELITNVSHDLRTPLTSIITYTDLLKNPDLPEDERTKYVDILDKKSARLKTLIEDLFEVSKMASGNIEILKQRVDLAQMLQQTVVEHEEDFTAAGLDLRVTIHEQPIYAYVDGQKWWRVVDNLLVNARKYSLEGTRVYVSLRAVAGVAELAVKNIAKYELGGNVEELTERFKRADTSRHTEGSGLGLAIAQSIVDLHGGSLVIDVDGDLFKVIVKVNIG